MTAEMTARAKKYGGFGTSTNSATEGLMTAGDFSISA